MAVAGAYNNWQLGQPSTGQQQAMSISGSPAGWQARSVWYPMISIVEYEHPGSDVALLLDADTYSGAGDWLDEAENGHSATFEVMNRHPVVFHNTTDSFGFDGTSCMEVDFDIGPDNFVNVSIEIWFKLDVDADLTATQGWIIGHDNGGFDRAIIVSDNRFGGMGSGVGFRYDAGLGYPSKGEWHQAVGVFSQLTPQGSFVALDGRIGTRVTARNDDSAEPDFTIGGLANSPGHGIQGDVKLVKIYHHALSDDEVAASYRHFMSRMSPGSPPPSGADVGSHRGYSLQNPVANLRRDMDHFINSDLAFSDARQFQGTGAGQWQLYNGAYDVDGSPWNGNMRPLGYSVDAVNGGSVLAGAFVSASAAAPNKIPAMRNGQLFRSDNENTPDENEVTVHPGNPDTDPRNMNLIVTYRASTSGWYFVTGSIRDLGTTMRGDGLTLDALWIDADGYLITESLGRVGRAAEGFQYMMWLGNGMNFSLVIGTTARRNAFNPGARTAAGLTVLVSPAENLSPFDFGTGPSNVSAPGANLLGSASVDLTGTPIAVGNSGTVQLSYTPDVPVGVSDTYSIEVDAAGLSARGQNVAFSATVRVGCGETVHYSAWILLNALPDVSQLNSIGLAVRPVGAATIPWHTTSCADALDNVAGGHSCVSRIGWLQTNRGMTSWEAKQRVASEFPTECGACGNLATAVDELTECPEEADWMAATGENYAAGDGGNSTCSSRVEWVKRNLNKTQSQALLQVGTEFPDACGCLSTIKFATWAFLHGSYVASASTGNAICEHGQGQAALSFNEGPENTREGCEQRCANTAGCIAFDFSLYPGDCLNGGGCAACRLFRPNTPQRGDGGPHGREYCTMAGDIEIGLVAAEPGMILRFADFDIAKTAGQSEANLGKESTRNDVTPAGFLIGGLDAEQLDLTLPVTNAAGTFTVQFNDDVPEDAVDPRSIEFNVSRSGAFAWAGSTVPICEGDIVQFSVWLKFIDTVPTYGNASCYSSTGGQHPLNGVAGQFRTVTPTAALCQQRCEHVQGCGYFSWWADGGCHITGTNATLTRIGSGSIVSGPKSCGDSVGDFIPGTYDIDYSNGYHCTYTVSSNGRVVVTDGSHGWGGTAIIADNDSGELSAEYPWMLIGGSEKRELAAFTVDGNGVPTMSLRHYNPAFCCTGTGIGRSVRQWASNRGDGGIGLKHHADADGSSGGDSEIYSEFLPIMRPNEWTRVQKTWQADYTADDLLILIMDSAPAGTRGRFADLQVTKLVHEPVLFFDGTGYVHFADTSNLPIGDSPYTIEAWVKAHTHGINGILGWGNWGHQDQVNALRLDTGGRLYNYWWNRDLLVDNIGSLDDDMWHHIAATYDGQNRTVVIDGVERKRDVPGVPHQATASDFRIGSTNQGEFFEGAIAEVRIWEVSRTADQIHAYMQADMDPNEEGLVGYWPLNDGGNSVRDLSPSAITGTLIGGLQYHSHDSFPPVYRRMDEFVVTIDDARGVTTAGAWSEFSDGNLRYLRAAPIAGETSTIEFVIDLPTAGTYDVALFMTFTNRSDVSLPAVTVVHRSGNTAVTPSAVAGWSSVGDFRFEAGPAQILISANSSSTELAVRGVQLTPASGEAHLGNDDPWAGQCKVVNTQFNPGVFHYTVFAERLPTRALTFSVRAANDAHVGLFVAPQDDQPGDGQEMYEIVIGGWANTQSVIRAAPQGDNLVTVATPSILDPNEWRQFWVTFSEGTIILGSGLIPGASGTEVMRYTDPSPKPVTYVGVGTGFNSGGSFDVCAVNDGDVISGEIRCPTSSYIVGGTACRAISQCELGQSELTAPTPTSDRTCRDCPAGSTDADRRPSTPCVQCTPGHYTVAGSSGPCNPQFRCPGGRTDADNNASTPCTECLPGTFSMTPGRRGQCRDWSATCAAGSEETATGSTTHDRHCSPCAIGRTFNPNPGDTCNQVQRCPVGKTEVAAPTLTSDRRCSTPTEPMVCGAGNYTYASAESCPNGGQATGFGCYSCDETVNFVYNMRYTQISIQDSTWTSQGLTGPIPYCQRYCTEMSGCTGFFYQPDLGGRRVCGFYSAAIGQATGDPDGSQVCRRFEGSGAGAPQCLPCDAGMTDRDFDASTRCIECPAGSFTLEGSSGTCASYACPAGSADLDEDPSTPCQQCTSFATYQPESGATECISVGPACAAGAEEDPAWGPDTVSQGPISARECRPCVLGETYKLQQGSQACTEVRAPCGVGTTERQAPTLILNRACRACIRGTYRAASMATCQPWTVCSSDEYQSVPPSMTGDRVCVLRTTDATCDILADLDSFYGCLDVSEDTRNKLATALQELAITTLPGLAAKTNGVLVEAMGTPPGQADLATFRAALNQLREIYPPTRPTSAQSRTTAESVATETVGGTTGDRCYLKRGHQLFPVDSCQYAPQTAAVCQVLIHDVGLLTCTGNCQTGLCYNQTVRPACPDYTTPRICASHGCHYIDRVGCRSTATVQPTRPGQTVPPTRPPTRPSSRAATTASGTATLRPAASLQQDDGGTNPVGTIVGIVAALFLGGIVAVWKHVRSRNASPISSKYHNISTNEAYSDYHGGGGSHDDEDDETLIELESTKNDAADPADYDVASFRKSTLDPKWGGAAVPPHAYATASARDAHDYTNAAALDENDYDLAPESPADDYMTVNPPEND